MYNKYIFINIHTNETGLPSAALLTLMLLFRLLRSFRSCSEQNRSRLSVTWGNEMKHRYMSSAQQHIDQRLQTWSTQSGWIMVLNFRNLWCRFCSGFFMDLIGAHGQLTGCEGVLRTINLFKSSVEAHANLGGVECEGGFNNWIIIKTTKFILHADAQFKSVYFPYAITHCTSAQFTLIVKQMRIECKMFAF